MAGHDALLSFGAHKKALELFDLVIPESVVVARVALCNEIIAILTTTVRTLRAKAHRE